MMRWSFNIWDALDRIFDLELEVFELQEKLSLLTEETKR